MYIDSHTDWDDDPAAFRDDYLCDSLELANVLREIKPKSHGLHDQVSAHYRDAGKTNKSIDE